MGDTQKHTQEPWMLVGEKTPHIASFVQNRGDICDLYHKRDDQRGLYIKENAEANGERIVACVNALEGIKNPAVIPELIEACERFVKGLYSASDETIISVKGPASGRRAIDIRNALSALSKDQQSLAVE